MKYLLLGIATLLLFSCNSAKKKATDTETRDSAANYNLELVWESDTLLRTPESVLFDRENNLLYISNINLNPWEKDGNGFISKMDLSGNILELKWIEGLSGPKGMGVYGNSLYIADIDELVVADRLSGEITERIKMEGKPDINDITVADDGTVYVSGSSSNKIYAFKEGKIGEFLQGGEERFNGLLWEKGKLYLLTSGSSQFKEIDPETRNVTVISEQMGQGDGIVAVGDGAHLTSSWAGAVFYVSPEGKATKILDTEPLKMNTADIDYSVADSLLFVPTFFDNRVKAYRLTKD